MFMKAAYIVISSIYGLLSIIAGISQRNNAISRIRHSGIYGLVGGGLLILLSIIGIITSQLYFVISLIVGLLILHIVALYNGRITYGKINVKHHLIRLLLSIWLVALFLMNFTTKPI